jgi:hypothetical protein
VDPFPPSRAGRMTTLTSVSDQTGATVYHGTNDYHRERSDARPGDARSEDLAGRPRYERRECDGQHCYTHEEDDRERHTARACHEYGHAESHWRAACEPTQGRRLDRDWEHLTGDLESRRERQFMEPEWRHSDGPAARSDTHAEHRRRYEQPLHAASGHQGRGLPNPDHRLSPPLVPPHAGGGPRLTGDAGAAWRPQPRESVTGLKRDRDWEHERECERDGEWVQRSELERSYGWARTHHGERRRPDTLSEGRVDNGI